MDQKGRERKNNSSNTIVWMVVAAVMLLSFGGPLITALLVAAIVMAVSYFVGKKLMKAREAKMGGIEVKKVFKTDDQLRERIKKGQPLQKQEEPRSYDPQAIQDRDSLRRLQQLDSFLKNGIIDKEEYRVLLAKYQRETNF